jgi:hypothetical protein
MRGLNFSFMTHGMLDILASTFAGKFLQAKGKYDCDCFED